MAAMVRRRVTCSLVEPESGASREMALGRSRRRRMLSPVLALSLRASGSLMAISLEPRAIFLLLGLSDQKLSSTPRI